MAQTVAKGTITLVVDERELEASLSFAPDPNGAEWTGEKLLRLAMDSRIGGLNQKRTEEIVGKFSRSRGPAVEQIAKGLAPEEPKSEEAEWAELTIPEELSDIVSAMLEDAPSPELYITKTEIIRTEKTVKKPAAFPFLPPKIEKIVVSEKRETKERVDVDLTVAKIGFARKDERIGLISPAKQGKVGKTIFGKPLQPLGEDNPFILGRGIVKSKNELLAAYDGVFRAGEHWAEIVPLESHVWSVEHSSDGITFFLNYTPGDARLPSPNPEEILAAAVKLGAPEASLVSSDDVAAMLADSAATGEPLFSRSLSLDRDASLELVVSPDGIRAVLNLRKGRGRGRPLDLKLLSAALKEAALKGVNFEQLKKDVLEFSKGSASDLLDYVLVEGKEPTRGKARSIALLVPALSEGKVEEILSRVLAHPALPALVPSLDEFAPSQATAIAYIKAGQKFAELSSGSIGQPGLDVRGKVIPGIPGNDPLIKTFENVELSKSGLTALVSGLLFASEHEGEWRFRAIPYKDATIEAGIAPDSLSAWLSLVAEEGLGAPLTAEAALEALSSKGVVFGFESGAVAEAVAAARAGQPVLKRVVARGREPVAAGSLRLTILVGSSSGSPLFSASRDTSRPIRVAKGDPILRIDKAVGGGEEGVDVRGVPIKAPASAAGGAVPTHDVSIIEEGGADGSLTYIAAVSGELIIGETSLSVRERLAIKGDIGPASGNVRFPGAVRVEGSVLNGFQLFAGGDASIGGSVEAALVSSDGAVSVGAGVKGQKRGTIRAKRTIDAAFTEQAVLLAVDDVRVKNSCILCNVKTNGKLLVMGEKGALIGGLCRARKGVEAAVLGSENGIKTEISFGQDYLVADLIEAEEREIEKLKALVVRTDKTMAGLGRAGADLDAIRQDKVKLLKLLEKRTHRIFDYREKFEEHIPSEIRVRGTVHPGVILESHNRFFEVRSKRTGVVFAFDPQSGRIVERPI